MTASPTENPHTSPEQAAHPHAPAANPQRSRILIHANAEDQMVAYMAAIAIGLTLLEAAIPSPLPGVKPGLANIVTLFVLLRFGWRIAAWVSLLRVIAGSLVLGSFLTPGFFLSLSGAICSLFILGISQALPPRWFGAVTHSIFAAFAHIAGQLLLVYFWLIPSSNIAYLLPVFATAALIFGTVNGLLASRLLALGPVDTQHASKIKQEAARFE